MKREKLNKLKLEVVIKFLCKEGQEKEVKRRLSKLITSHIQQLEGLAYNFLPWSKSYYFSVRDVKLNTIK